MNPHVRTGVGTAVGIALGIAGSTALVSKPTLPVPPAALLAEHVSTATYCAYHHRGHWHELQRKNDEPCDSTNQLAMQAEIEAYEDQLVAPYRLDKR